MKPACMRHVLQAALHGFFDVQTAAGVNRCLAKEFVLIHPHAILRHIDPYASFLSRYLTKITIVNDYYRF
jgi:hypothetical protein